MFFIRPLSWIADAQRLLLAANWLVLIAAVQARDTTPAAQEAPPVLYRRVFVPADKIEAWPREGEKYLPIDARDFAAWVEKANRLRSSTRTANITEAEYSARMEGNQLIKGRGRWVVETSGDEPVLLPLENLSLMIREPRWQDPPHTPARLGIWGRSGEGASVRGLEVPRPGVVEFAWQLRAEALHDGTEFAWQVPVATEARLTLDLPEGKEPHIDGSVVLDAQPLPPNPGTPAEARRRWKLALRPSIGDTLRITDSGKARVVVAPALAMHDEVTYRITQRGLDIETTWQLAGATVAQRELTLPLPSDVQLVSVLSAGRGLPWRLVEGRAAAPAAVRIELPKRDAHETIRLTVRAWQPLVVGQPWQLPVLRPEHVFWTSGNVELSVARSLEIRDLHCRNLVQTAVSQENDAASGGENIQLAAYSPTAALTVALGHRPADAIIRVGSSLTMADPDISGRHSAQWTVSEGSLHKLSGELAPGWIVEAVETRPSEALNEWFIDRREGRDLLVIQLSRAAAPARDVTVTVTGRLQRLGLRTPISVKALRMIEWRAGRMEKHLLSFQPLEPYDVETVGKLPTVASHEIGGDAGRLFEELAAEDTVYDLTQASTSAGLHLAPKRGRYEADIRLDVACSPEQLRQAHHISIRPTIGRVDRVLVFATRPLGDEVRWVETASGAPVSAERVPDEDPRRASLPADGELWLVRFARPAASAYEISATLAAPLKSPQQMPLLGLPDAVEQRGRFLMRAEGELMPLVDSRGMRAIPLPIDAEAAAVKSPGRDLPPVRASFRFNPADCLSAVGGPALRLSPSVGETRSQIVRRLELDSFYRPDGAASHRATYRLESDGAESFELRVGDTESTAIRAISMNGHVLEQPPSSDSVGAIKVPLPGGSAAATVAVHFETQNAPLRAGGEIVAPLLHHEVPVLAGEWMIWLPEEFSAVGAAVSPRNARLTWRERLFGPLGRPPGSRPFNPFRAADWFRITDGSGMLAISRAEAADDDNRSQADAERRLSGWRSHIVPFVAEAPSAIVVAHPSAVVSWTVAVFLSCFVLGNLLRRRRTDALIVAAAVAAALCFVLPVVYVPLATGGFLGLLFSPLAAWPRRQAADHSVHSWSHVSTVALPAIAIAVCIGSVAYGQATATKPGPRDSIPANMHRVLIPVTPEGRQAGNQYFVSEAFLRELLRAAQDAAASAGHWLLLDAHYTGELLNRVNAEGIAAGKWTLSFEIEVLARDTTVLLPLIQREATWQATALLDGVPAPLTWRGGRGCSVQVAEPGRYSLTVFCTPHTLETSMENQLKLTIPPLPGGRFRLSFPPDIAGLKLQGAVISSSGADLIGVVERELAGSDPLELRWFPTSLPPGSPQVTRVTGMRWLRIGLGQVELETKYVVEGVARRPNALMLQVDNRWALVPDAKAATEANVTDLPDGRRSVRIPLPSTEADRQVVQLRWRLETHGDSPWRPNGSSLGRLRLPPIELVSVPVTQRWFAVSADPTLECDVSGSGGSPGRASEFLATWGRPESSVAPQIVLQNIDPAAMMSVSVRPRQIAAEIDDVLHVAVGRQADGARLRLVYQAEVTPAGLHSYQFPLVVSPAISIDKISATHEGRSIPLRWSRSSAQNINVFFMEPVKEEYHLVLDGTLRPEGSGPHSLPHIAPANSTAMSQQVQLYREEDVLLDLEGLIEKDQAAEVAAKSPPPSWTARPVAVYRLGKEAADRVRFRQRNNDVKLSGSSLISLARQPDTWSASLRARFVVEQGQLDALRLRVPPTWVGPFTVESNVPAAATIVHREAEHAIVSVRFETSVEAGSKVNLSIEGPLTFAAPSFIAAPDIALQPLPEGRQYLQVSATLEKQPISWSEGGVRPTELPPELRDVNNETTPSGIASAEPRASTPAAATRVFEVVSRPFHVAIRPPASVQPVPRVRLADAIVTTGIEAGLLIQTRLVLAPHGLAECTVQVPTGQELLAIRLDGKPTLFRQAAHGRYGIPVGPGQLPRILEVLTRSTVAAGGDGDGEIRRPVLLANDKPIDVEMSFWSVGYPQSSPRPRVADVGLVPAAEHAAAQLDRLISIAESSTPAAVQSPLPDGYNWFRPWAAFLIAMRQEALETMEQSLARRPVLQVPQAPDEQVATLSQRLDEWIEECNDILTWPDLALSMPEFSSVQIPEWPQWMPHSENRVYCVAEGGLDRLTLESVSAPAAASRSRATGLLTVAAIAAAGIWLVRRSLTWDVLYRWPHALVFLLGLAYWAWLWPSWLGLFVASISTVLAFRLGWPGRSLPIEGSTVLRVDQPT